MVRCGVVYVFLLFFYAATFATENDSGYVSSVWSPDLKNGTYKNPVLFADYSDPDVCRVGDVFYMTASSFNAVPGLPILRSYDLVNWELVGYALKELSPVDYFSEVQHGKGVWAPSIRYHGGKFYIYWGDPDRGVFMICAEDVNGQWSVPILVKEGKGIIDPCPLWDDDGRVYLAFAWAASRLKINSVICVAEMNSSGTKVIGETCIVFDGNDDLNHTAEGPKFYKREGFYYLLFPAGGVSMGWQMAARSRNVYGPYVARCVMEQGESDCNGPHQGGWITTPMGEDWFVHFQDRGYMGRVVWLEPMKWMDGWPVIGKDDDGDGVGNPVSVYQKPKVSSSVLVNPVENDEFDDSRLGVQWQWPGNRSDLFAMPTSYGFIRLYSHPKKKDGCNLWEQPNMMLQKFPCEEFVATTKFTLSCKEAGQEGGLIVMGLDYACITICRVDDHFCVCIRKCLSADNGNAEECYVVTTLPESLRQTIEYAPTINREIFLRIVVNKGGLCSFSYSIDGVSFEDTGYTFEAREGKWIGAKIGLVCFEPYVEPEHLRGWMDVEWFHIDNK